MPQRPSARGLIFRNGLIFGLITIAIDVASFLISRQLGLFAAAVTTTDNSTIGQFVPWIFFGGIYLLNLSLLFVAGMLTARTTGSVGAASLTGLVAGFVQELLPGIVVSVVLFGAFKSELWGPPPANQQWVSFVIGSLISGILIGLISNCSIGAGMSALGGLAGRNTYLRASRRSRFKERPTPARTPTRRIPRRPTPASQAIRRLRSGRKSQSHLSTGSLGPPLYNDYSPFAPFALPPRASIYHGSGAALARRSPAVSVTRRANLFCK